MNTHTLFLNFDSAVRLNDSKISKLKSNRKALRDKVSNYFKDNGWDTPNFYSQGSFPLKTNLNPIKKITDDGDVKEEYDLDDGVYFICPRSDRKEPSTYHDRIKKAVDDHAESVVDKNTCVRVVYADGHHIDLPSYWVEKNGDIPQLAHKSKGYIDSDPKAFKEWVDDNISNANSNGQLRRVIRHLKAWKNYRENKNSSLKLPSGFILTILACRNFSNNSRDDLAFKNTIESIKKALDLSFTCYRPTVPTNEELLASYSKDSTLEELRKLVSNAQGAIDSDCEKEASEYWRRTFGDRFPLGKENSEISTQSDSYSAIRTKVSSPWLSN
ncbi:cyclic GMP-AMP synthase DncV-like nucleotidyltransferase [Methanococcoides sp. NM1]|uniref:cyclic GMP-AMP synthase DncV-like nucleotidyltransferase n=1 Tax=Methanococcoides sp. NM1 TaxID=1201013 RepID=UPI0010835F07|nr:hypothetical protein [Methanococcoides sp. NM1]